jgi:hypothetical protein
MTAFFGSLLMRARCLSAFAKRPSAFAATSRSGNADACLVRWFRRSIVALYMVMCRELNKHTALDNLDQKKSPAGTGLSVAGYQRAGCRNCDIAGPAECRRRQPRVGECMLTSRCSQADARKRRIRAVAELRERLPPVRGTRRRDPRRWLPFRRRRHEPASAVSGSATGRSGRPSRPRRDFFEFGPSGGGMVKALSTLV